MCPSLIREAKKHTIKISWEELTPEELTPEERRTCETAKIASRYAFAPFSGYHVGAAVLCKDGTIVAGSNQENYCFSPTEHAEQVACSGAAAQGKGDQITAIACLAGTGERFVAPCGLCLTTMAQYEQRSGQQMVILFGGLDLQKVARVVGVKTLMPFSFVPSDLGDLER